MPEFNGAQLALAAREHYPQLPVVFLTGYAELDNMELPNSLLIQKPVHEHVLALALAELLENREQKRKNRPEAMARYC
jgi:FixJ family two-component response regulator